LLTTIYRAPVLPRSLCTLGDQLIALFAIAHNKTVRGVWTLLRKLRLGRPRRLRQTQLLLRPLSMSLRQARLQACPLCGRALNAVRDHHMLKDGEHFNNLYPHLHDEQWRERV